MTLMRMPALWPATLAAVFLIGGCQHASDPKGDLANKDRLGAKEGFSGPSKDTPRIRFTRVSGPYTHENLSVFLIHSFQPDKRSFLTLPEGLKTDKVKITEKENEQVGELLVDNQSDQPLYLQEGERLQGGKQDRTIIASLVIPARSGKVAIPTACIEQSRWEEASNGRKFSYTANAAFAPKGVRGAAKVEGSQEKVWRCVAVQKDTAKVELKTMNTNSSANEMLDSEKAKEVSDQFARAFRATLARNRDAVGVAIVVHGQIEEVNVYPSHELLAKLMPRLVGSYAVQTKMYKAKGKQTKPPSAATVAKLLAGGKGKLLEKRKVNNDNAIRINQLPDNCFLCTTHYKGKLVHWQVMKKTAVGSEKHAMDKKAKLGGDW
jgi:hypothetical protein